MIVVRFLLLYLYSPLPNHNTDLKLGVWSTSNSAQFLTQEGKADHLSVDFSDSENCTCRNGITSLPKFLGTINVLLAEYCEGGAGKVQRQVEN